MALKLAPLIYLYSTVLQFAYALNNGLARTPPMGWNPYNAFLSVSFPIDSFIMGLILGLSLDVTLPRRSINLQLRVSLIWVLKILDTSTLICEAETIVY